MRTGINLSGIPPAGSEYEKRLPRCVVAALPVYPGTFLQAGCMTCVNINREKILTSYSYEYLRLLIPYCCSPGFVKRWNQGEYSYIVSIQTTVLQLGGGGGGCLGGYMVGEECYKA